VEKRDARPRAARIARLEECGVVSAGMSNHPGNACGGGAHPEHGTCSARQPAGGDGTPVPSAVARHLYEHLPAAGHDPPRSARRDARRPQGLTPFAGTDRTPRTKRPPTASLSGARERHCGRGSQVAEGRRHDRGLPEEARHAEYGVTDRTKQRHLTDSPRLAAGRRDVEVRPTPCPPGRATRKDDRGQARNLGAIPGAVRARGVTSLQRPRS
jgi:hypothetical protein